MELRANRLTGLLACGAAVAAVLLAPAPARADDDDLLGSIYTENGYELRRDERLFTLYAAFTAAGFDRADQARTLPFPRPVVHPVREKLRQALTDPALRRAVDLYLDTHPQPVETYVTAALALGDSPEFAAPAGAAKELAGLDKMLAEFARNAKLAKVSRQLATDFRAELKRLRAPLDAPFAALRAAYRLREEDAPGLVLEPVPFDWPQLALARRAEDGHVVVFGVSAPDRAFDPQPALRAYSTLLAQEAVSDVPLPELNDAVAQLRAAGLEVTDARALVADSLKAAVESRLWSKDAPAALDASFKRGLLFAREFAKALEEPAKEAEKGFAARVVAQTDVRKALAELVPAKK